MDKLVLIVTPPDRNDSFSRLVLLGKEYQMRFTWNDTGQYWTFGIYDQQRSPYVAGIRIVPNSLLNFFYQSHELPHGFFLAQTKLEQIGREDFQNGKAKFLFVPYEDLEGGQDG